LGEPGKQEEDVFRIIIVVLREATTVEKGEGASKGDQMTVKVRTTRGTW